MSARKDPRVDPVTEQGMNAIIFLQGMVGIGTTRQEARLAWEEMNEADRLETLETHQQIIKLTNR